MLARKHLGRGSLPFTRCILLSPHSRFRIPVQWRQRGAVDEESSHAFIGDLVLALSSAHPFFKANLDCTRLVASFVPNYFIDTWVVLSPLLSPLAGPNAQYLQVTHSSPECYACFTTHPNPLIPSSHFRFRPVDEDPNIFNIVIKHSDKGVHTHYAEFHLGNHIIQHRGYNSMQVNSCFYLKHFPGTGFRNFAIGIRGKPELCLVMEEGRGLVIAQMPESVNEEEGEKEREKREDKERRGKKMKLMKGGMEGLERQKEAKKAAEAAQGYSKLWRVVLVDDIERRVSEWDEEREARWSSGKETGKKRSRREGEKKGKTTKRK